MSRFTIWYAKLSRRSRISLICGGIAVAAIVFIIVAYMILVPKKVQVTYGTRVVDPIDGYVWEDNTQTIWVDPSEASKYSIEVEVKYSDEHLAQLEQEKVQRQETQQALQQSSGYELTRFVVPTAQLEDLRTMQMNMQVIGETVLTGMDVANQIDEVRNYLVSFRNQAATYPLPPELESMRREFLQPLDMVIQACSLYLQAISTASKQYLDQANSLIRQAMVIWQDLMRKYQNLFSDLEKMIPELQKMVPNQ